MSERNIMEDLPLHIERVRRYNEEARRVAGRQPAAYSRTYGCQQNASDGEKLNGLLAEMGYRICDSAGEADVILYNTCAVRGGAEDRVFGNVGDLKRLKTANPSLIIAVCGCMTQQKHIIERIKNHYPFVDIIFGAGAMHQLPGLLCQKLHSSDRIFDVADPSFDIVEELPIRREGAVQAGIPIMNGCDNFCSYCVVPYARGRERSRDPDRIVEEARALVAEGYREITLLGQNVNSYGKGLAEEINFSELLRRVCAIPGDFRLRFMTSHPKDCTHELIDTIAEQDKICNHIHLPVQSGSDRILREMNRRYTADDYKALIQTARQKIPGVTFTSDIIIGFPGETRDDVERTLELVEHVGYHSLFTFLYSPRKGTAAYGLEDTVPLEEKKRWFNELLEVQNRITAQKLREMEGKTYRVLADGCARSGEEGWLTGRSDSGVIVDFKAPDNKIGCFVDVCVTRAAHWAVIGEWSDASL